MLRYKDEIVARLYWEEDMVEHEATGTMPPQISKPIKWIIPESIRTDHATHLIVQQQGTEFTLLFFEVRGPLFTGTPEEQVAAMQRLENVEATCIARIVMSIENVPQAIQNFMETWNNAVMQMTKGQENARDAEHTELSPTNN
jgi:hypothetical protein